jgi:hypothetical protein
MKPNGAKRTIRVFKAALTFVADSGGISRRPWNGLVLNIEDSSDASHHIILTITTGEPSGRRRIVTAKHLGCSSKFWTKPAAIANGTADGR